MVASYDCATLKATELFSKAILLTMFDYGVSNFVLHLSVVGGAGIAESTHLKGYPHTFVCTVHSESIQTP